MRLSSTRILDAAGARPVFRNVSHMPDVTWVLESGVFPETHEPIRRAIRDRGHRLLEWSDAWWTDGVPSRVPESAVVFHGSLGNAVRITTELRWTPGAFCRVEPFRCAAWYESARQWLVHRDWIICPAKELIENARPIAERLSASDRLFVRPDSPLKPFSGRVVDVATLTLAKLDYGFYYDDEMLSVVVAPVQEISMEWRFVVANRSVISGSAYDAATRKPVPVPADSAATRFASTVASKLPEPDSVYVLDVCQADGDFRLLELNPFGGADLYACDAGAIIDRVSAIAAAA